VLAICAAGASLTFAATAGGAASLVVSVTDSKSHALPQAAVYLTGGPENRVVPRDPVIVDQRLRQFEPRVTVVRTGTEITFPNNDTVRHWVYSVSPVKKIRLSLAVGEKSAPVLFDKPGIVTIGCNLHDEMSAWIVVVDTPLAATTDAAGRVEWRDLKPGTYSLYAWYPGLDQPLGPQQVVVNGDAPQARELRLAASPL
jgi:plastocyanin